MGTADIPKTGNAEESTKKLPSIPKNRKERKSLSTKEIDRKSIERISPKARKKSKGKIEGENDASKEGIEFIRNFYDPKNFPAGFDEWPRKDQDAWIMERMKPYRRGCPESLRHLDACIIRPGDCGREATEKPDWLDLRKFEMGQKFIKEHFFGIAFSITMSFFAVYTFADGLRPIIITGRSNTPFTSFRRYIGNVRSVWLWCTSDPWTPGSRAHKDLQLVRKKHQAVSRLLGAKSNEEINRDTLIPNAFCPTRKELLDDFRAGCSKKKPLDRPYYLLGDSPWRPKGINQADMVIAQAGFLGLILIYPEYYGVRNVSEEVWDAFCHFWRGIGFILGVEDEHNLCAGSAKEVRSRMKDLVDYGFKPNLREISEEWEHVTRCLSMGIGYYLFDIPYETLMLYIAKMLEIPMPRLRAVTSYYAWFIGKIGELYFFYLSKIPGMAAIVNKATVLTLNRALNFSPKMIAKLKEKSRKSMLLWNSRNIQ